MKTLLAILSNLIKLDEYDSDTMTQKSTYVSTVDKSGQSMCAGLVSGEPAIVADDVLAAVRSEKNNFNSVDAVYIDMACTACPKSVKSTAKMLLGTALKASYQSWNCASGKQCSGVCVVSSQVNFSLRILTSLFPCSSAPYHPDFVLQHIDSPPAKIKRGSCGYFGRQITPLCNSSREKVVLDVGFLLRGQKVGLGVEVTCEFIREIYMYYARPFIIL